MSGRLRQLLKRLHPEGIPWPGSVLYNALSGSRIFLQHYDLVARDVASYGPARNILDIGTGPGRLLAALRKTFPDADLVGIDVSPAMVEQARRNMKQHGWDSRMIVEVARVEALLCPDGAFDRVVSTGSIHHWKDYGLALSEIHRVLKPGGYALLYDLVRNMPKEVREEVRGSFGGFRLALLWLHSFEEPFLNVEEMEAIGKQSEFEFEGVRFTGALCCLVLRKGRPMGGSENLKQG